MEALAARVHTTASQISKLEKGRVALTIDWLYRLAGALDCHWSELVEDVAPSSTSTDERALLEIYRGVARSERSAFLSAIGILVNLGRKGGDDGSTT